MNKTEKIEKAKNLFKNNDMVQVKLIGKYEDSLNWYLKIDNMQLAKASGYGYDKIGACLSKLLNSVFIEELQSLDKNKFASFEIYQENNLIKVDLDDTKAIKALNMLGYYVILDSEKRNEDIIIKKYNFIKMSSEAGLKIDIPWQKLYN